MGIAIELYLNKEDYNQVKYLFDTDDNPDFIIVSESHGDTFISLQVYFNSTISLWHLAKRVEMYNAHNKRMAEIKAEIEKKTTKCR